jgi:hypothetical protein
VIGAALWGGGSGLALLLACLWQILAKGYSATQFMPMLIFACIYARTNSRVVFYGFSLKSGISMISILLKTSQTVRNDTEAIVGAELSLGAAPVRLAIADVHAGV